MTLTELREQCLSGKISILKFTRMASKFKDALTEMYPDPIPLNGKIYLYLHGKEISNGLCDISKKSKSFKGVNLGFRPFCGNQNQCVCNKNNKNEYWKNLDKQEIKAMADKRKNTVQNLYGVDSVSQLSESKEKAAETCLKKYGTKSPTQNRTILQKSQETCLKNNGVKFPQQNKEILDKTTKVFKEKYNITRPAQSIIFLTKAKQTIIKKYGVENVMQDCDIAKKASFSWKKNKFEEFLSSRETITPLFNAEEYGNCSTEDLLLWKCNDCDTEFFSKFKLANERTCPKCNPKGFTWGELLIKNWLDDLEIEYIFGSYNVIPPLQLDFFIPKLNLAIEFNGLYWHSELAGRHKNYHFEKFKKCNDKNIKLIQIFEHELIKNEDLIKSRLVSALGKIQNKKYARNLKIKTLPYSQAKLFFETNHTQGSVPSKFNYALYDEEKIYSVMSFSKSRYSKSLADWELTRFASLNQNIVVGAASKLFNFFTKTNNITSVVSYADLQWGKGNVYSTMGFVFSHFSKPNYWYFKGIDSIQSRVKFQKHKLPNELHYLGSEWEIMKHLGWNRYWDSGNAVWVWKN